ncbi:MAG TPA: protein kinase [Acidobacteriota bacterium]|nr:protein kinase [Acidobacteriota bacterium]
MIGQRVAHYEILELLDQGGMGVVYKARDTRLGRLVVLKFLPRRFANDGAALGRFEREARAASALDHRSICPVFDVGEYDGQPFMAMPYLKGRTLKERLAEGPVPMDLALHFGIQLAEALEVAHSNRIIHRDIKPANIFVTDRNETKILDFGLSKIVRDTEPDQARDEEPSILTRRGTAIGTAGYMSPEQAFGESVDQRTDLFSLGVVLYEMVTGKPPFRGPNPLAVVGQVLTHCPPSVLQVNPELPAELDRIISKAMAKRREARYQSAREMMSDLQKLRDASSPEIQASLARAAQSRTRRRGIRFGIVLLSAFAFVLVVALLRQYQNSGSGVGDLVLRPLTFKPGLQLDPAISPDSRFIAYASANNGRFDLLVQEVGEETPRLFVASDAHDWQPTWSPDGTRIAFRSERDGGGLYIARATGEDLRRISSFGYEPQWSPDGSRILFFNTPYTLYESREIYVVKLDGSLPVRFSSRFLDQLIVVTAGWRPDGQITVAGQLGIAGKRGLWTGDFETGQFTYHEATSEVTKRAADLGLALAEVSSFVWAPSGRRLFFNAPSKGVINLWSVAVDSSSRLIGLERLTTGPGIDTNLSISANGARLVFNTIIESLRLWSFPFQSTTGKMLGPGQPISPGDLRAAAPDITDDGRRLVFAGFRADVSPRLWVRSLTEDSAPVSLGTLYGAFPRWSRDGARLAYQADGRIRIVQPESQAQEQIAASSEADFAPGTWSKDSEWILTSRAVGESRRMEIWKLPVKPGPGREPRRVAAHPAKNLWQPRYSPDDQWICFNAVDTLQTGNSSIYVIPAEGGEWRQITSGEGWDDKARWSPDGRTLYYLSSHGGFLNLWGVPFDTRTGSTRGEPFQITHLETPARCIWQDLGLMEIAVATDRFVAPLMERTGHVWMLENLTE